MHYERRSGACHLAMAIPSLCPEPVQSTETFACGQRSPVQPAPRGRHGAAHSHWRL